MRRKSKALGMLLSTSALLVALCSCVAGTRHLAFATIEQAGWAQADTLSYTIPPLGKVAGKCGFTLLLHTERYAYENIALGITITQDSTRLYHEQRSYLLGEHETKRGIGHRIEYTLPIGNVALCDTLPTTITITQQLHDTLLGGISKVGIHIAKPLLEPGEVEWKVDWH